MFSRCMHVVACVGTSFLLMAEQDSIVCTDRVFLSCLSTDVPLSSFYLVATVKSAARTCVCRYLFAYQFSFLWGMYEVGIISIRILCGNLIQRNYVC